MYRIFNRKRKVWIPLFCVAVFALLALALSVSKTLTASDGASYEITVTYDASARIPAGASLEVSELSGARYQSYYDRAVAELGRFERMRAFDIRCLAPDGSEIEPAAPVKVAFRLPGSGAARILHFVDGGGVTAPSPQKGGGGALNIETDSFSVYAVVETEPISAPLTVSEKFIDFTTDLFPAYLLEGENPENDPVQEPGDDTEPNPEDQQGDDPGQNTGDQPGDEPGQEPGDNPGDEPGQEPGDNPGDEPGQEPGTQPGNDPEPNPEDQPGEVTITADDKTKVEGAPEPTLTATVEGLSGEDTISYTLNRVSGESIGTYTITPSGDEVQDDYHVTYQTGTLTIVSVEAALKKELTSLDGNWATWKIDVNSGEHTFNDGKPFTLTDTFTEEQSIDYSSISVTELVSTDTEEPPAERVTYDYRGNTGTYVIPDKTHVTITYRTHIAVQSVENVTFGNTAVLTKRDSGEQIAQIAEVTLSRTETIYPSASEAADNAGVYMLRLFVYGNNNMREGIPGAQFILLDENQRPMTFKQGDNLGDPVTFTTDENGYADIQIDEESGNPPIQKNTSYYLEMIRAPQGFKKDNTLYNFMITDNAAYDSGGIWTYRNRDILKVRLQPEAPGLNVCMRFSGNYALRDDQKNAIAVILQKLTEEDTWQEVERHTVSEFSYGSFTFGEGLEVGEHYRVIEENERPLDVPDIVNLTTSYYLVIGPGSSDPLNAPPEFDVTDENKDSSFNIIISNEYEEHKLTITKMEKETGHRLPGAKFTVKKAANDEEVETYTTDANGVLEISGGADYEADTLYYIVETKAPEGYLLPLVPPKVYFYFCNDSYLIPGILSSLPNGETAENLWETYDSVTMDNQSETRTIPVMQIWEGNTWPDRVNHVVVGLYQSVNGEEPRPVTYEDGTQKTVVLTKHAPYNNSAFTSLPTRDEQNRTIVYSVKEEGIFTGEDETPDTNILADYVQQYGVSGSGVYIIRNKQATSLTVVKEWQDSDGIQITADETLAAQPDIKFDVYRSTQSAFEEPHDGQITNDIMTNAIRDMKKVRDGLSFGHSDGWQMTIKDLEKKDDTGNPYYYYILETVPSFGDEVYELADGKITIRNQVLPATTTLTVQKAELVNDPRTEAVHTDFGFTLALAKDTHPIRSYQVYDGDGEDDTLTTDWDGKVRFTLKPEQSIVLTLPAGVTATVTEDANPQYRESATATDVADLDGTENNAFSYKTTAATPVTITFTNTLRVICKVTDTDNKDHPYESLQSALKYIRDNLDTFHGTATIQMLEDYSMPATDEFNIQEGENITLTTAETDESMQFHFQTDRENASTAIITRAGEGGSLLANAGTLTLENVCLDGAKDSFTATSDGGLVNNTGVLNLNGGATLRNSKTSGKGGAVYSTGTVSIINGAEITGNAAGSGSAVYLAGGRLDITGGHITENVGTSDGAVTVEDTESKINLSENPFIYGNTNAQGEQANLYIGADSDSILNVVDPGLAHDALIGVTAMEGHREIAEQFGIAEYEMTDNLDRFINDLYYYRAKLKEGTSTNIVWDGLTLNIKNLVDDLGANPNDTFTLTLSSTSIRKSNYTIDGTLNYSITAAKRTNPGTIVLRNLEKDDAISISPLPVGDYRISVQASNYATTRTGTNSETNEPIDIDEDGNFSLEKNSVLTVTHARRLAQVKLTKTLFDPLAGNSSVDFPFTLTLKEANGTPVGSFPLTDQLATAANGTASTTFSIKHGQEGELTFKAPVGATLNITENPNANYRITASGSTMPTEGEGVAIENTASGNAFAFGVTDDGASVTFSNVRKMATIELRKELVNKVSTAETFTFTVTLTNADETLAAGYPVYEDAENPENNIVTDENGKAVIPFDFSADVTSRSVALNIPEGTKLTVEETEVKKNVNGTEQPIYDTKYSINGGNAQDGLTAVINSVTENDSSIVFTNTRKMRTVTVKNTVSGYSGNTEPFTFTATVADGAGYNSNGFTNGVQTFKLSTGQSKALTVPYGETLNVAETFIVGYETKINNTVTNAIEFVVTGDKELNFTNTQLINLILDNKCSSEITDVSVYVSTSKKMYRVNDAGTGQEEVILKNRTAKVSVDAGKTAILEVEYTANQIYKVSGRTPVDGYLYTIVNEPAYHEDAKPAIMRVYNTKDFTVEGNLRYGPADSTVTFSEQPLVSFNVNGGAWTTEMEGYHDRDGDRKIYQYAVNVGEQAPKPTPPIYPASGVSFLGWTQNPETSALYDFNTPVTEPVTLYAVWGGVQSGRHIVTLKNGVNEDVDVTVIHDDDTLTQTSFSLEPGDTENLPVNDGAKLAVTWTGSAFSYSTEFPTVNNKTGTAGFTIDSVEQSGTIAFIDGVCKITDADGNTLYDANGNPAVYMKLSDAFTAYVGTLYTTAAHTQAATPAAVKMLVEEYPITEKTPFPKKDVTVTTAGKNDADFPYVGVREHATLYRDSGFTNGLFTHQASATSVTLKNIILDGRDILNNINGSLIYLNYVGAQLNITEGAVLRNSNTTADCGGAIYANNNGTLNIDAGIFSNLRAKQGGAICVNGNATLNLTGTNGGTRFENCVAETDDGGAVYYSSSKALTIDGDTDKDNPGIVFTACEAKSNAGDGGAIYATGSFNISISGCAFTECSAKNNTGGSTTGFGGGGIGAKNVKSVTVSQCAFTACDTLRGGGAVMAYVKTNESISISDCSFDSCNCKAQGGALSVYQDNNGNKTSTTTLIITGCDFNNCSSGTENGSGGAIQSYVPRMEFTDSKFIDCWAGKEGGAVNNYFGNSIGEMWSTSYMKVTNCHFIRCRAEDRYDITSLVHYGGGINTKVVRAEVKDSYFEDCVSTLREGGALHFCGMNNGSQAIVEGSTFKNCEAKISGGALMASNESLTISNSKFYGCSALTDGGGAVCHSKNSRNDSTQNSTTITNCIFSPASESESGCNAVNGGAVWTRAKTVAITGCTIDKCTAANNGGGVYLAKNGDNPSNGTISGGTITGCRAQNGSAVYQEDKATYSGATVTGNTATDANGGAIAGGTMYFEGLVTVKDNTYSGDSTVQHNVVLHVDNNTTINTTEAGLDENAVVRVYVVTGNVYTNHGHEGQPFGTYSAGSGNAYLENFVNDRDERLYGYGYENLIYWGTYVCKITDADGNTLKRPNGKDAVYQSISVAFDDFTKVTGEAVYVKMLVQTHREQQVTNFPAANVTLTTASTSDSQHPYRGTAGTVCTLYPSNGQLFKLDNAATVFQLENITLDGRKNPATETEGAYRLIEAVKGSLIINGGTTLQYGKADNGGAVYAADTARLTINSKTGSNVLFDRCVCNSGKTGGGAIYAKCGVTITREGNGVTRFTNCTAPRGGAVMVDKNDANVNVDIDGTEFSECHSEFEGGALYHNNNNKDAAYTKIQNSVFTDCYTLYDEHLSYGGAANSKAGTLTVESSQFNNCSAKSNGGAINHGSENNDRVKTTISDTTFTGCKTTGNNNSFGYGGSVYTQAIAVEITRCTVENSTAYNHGGALYCENNSNGSTTTISGSSFDNCSVTRSDGIGGAIYSKGKALTIQDDEGGQNSVINACTAPRYSGAVYMETSESTLNISGNTKISGCSADKGGAVYLKSGVKMYLAGSPEFTKNGYVLNNTASALNATDGACFYLEQGSSLYLKDSPKFSRNIITGKRVLNGSITDYALQDIYLAGYANNNQAQSIHIAGELTGDTIWVWPECAPHRLHSEQFAVVDDNSISDATLSKFRNALSDDITKCSNGEYLAGVRGNTGKNIGETTAKQNSNYAYWDKMYNISFRKTDGKTRAGLPGAEFMLYRDLSCTEQIAVAVSAQEETDTDAQGNFLAKGEVYFTTVPIGVYYMRETQTPDGFKDNTTTYLFLVGTPALDSTTPIYQELWRTGPLQVNNAQNRVLRLTTIAGKGYGLFALDENNKAILNANLAFTSDGIGNIRNDYEASFMKVDSSEIALPDATFTLYVPEETDAEGNPTTYENGYRYPKLTEWKRDADDASTSATSAGRAYNGRDSAGNLLPRGLVYFRELPKGTYYLKETGYPIRNGSNRQTFYVESDRVFRLEINGDAGFTLKEWNADTGDYDEVEKISGRYVIRNTEAVCKLTDAYNNLLYELGHDGVTLIPAVYATLQEGFEAVQHHVLLNAGGAEVANDTLNPALKLMVLKDFTLTEPITYNSPRALTFTTAATYSTPQDKYHFVTTRTTDRERAEIKRGYDEENTADGALITVAGGASLTLEKINLNGQKSSYSGRALRVVSGTLNVKSYTLIQNFTTEGDGGAVRMESGTTLDIAGGLRKDATAQFSGNKASNGGALSLSEACTVNISNAQFTSNTATGNGGAVDVPDIPVTLTNAVFTSNQATGNGGAVYVGSGGSMTLQGGSMTSNRADGENGGAINVEDDTSRLSFGGSPVIWDNFSGGERRNVVLHMDSNDVIRTTEAGLTGGQIGVYVIGEISGELFQKHGRQDTPFGTFGGANRRNANAFTNDRNTKLYGTQKADEDEIYWIPYVGSLQVTKTVNSALAADEKIDFTFKVTLNDKTIHGTYDGMTFDENSAATFTLKHGESVTATGLPVDLDGGYTVEETIEAAVADNFAPTISVKGVSGVTSGTRRTGTITKDKTSEVTFTNTHKTGNLVIRKTVVSSQSSDRNQSFNFTLTLTGGTVKDGLYGGVRFTDNSAPILLKHGGSVTATGLPVGIAYEVTEAEDSNFITVSTGETGIVSTTQSVAAFTNVRKENGLTVSKTVVSRLKEDKDQPFTFKVTLENGNEQQFDLKDGEYKILTGLPENVRYTVTETTDSNFTTVSTGETGTIGQDFVALFTNTRKTGDLTVSKTVFNPQPGDEDTDFHFKVTITSGGTLEDGTYGDMKFENNVAKFDLKHGGSVTATGLPVGVGYRVEEDTDSNFITNSTGATGTIKEAKSEAVFANTHKTNGLTVGKTVVSPRSADKDQPFTFKVTLDDTTVNGPYGQMTFTNGVAEFDLKHGESKTATDLPENVRYTVTETTDSNFTTVSTGETGIIGQDFVALFTNTRKDVNDVRFKKVDGFGEAIGDTVTDAEFTLYTDKDCTQRVQSLDNEAQATYIGGGYYRFQNVPSDVYYMKEDKPPTGYAPTSDDNKYIVFVGDEGWKKANDEGLVGDVTRKPGVEFGIFLYSDGQAQSTPNLQAGIMNVSEDTSPVILRKIGEDGKDADGNDKYKSLEHAVFDILYWDKTPVPGASGLESASNGVFWIGNLPHGNYYLRETTIPDRYAAITDTSKNENWFKFTVGADGASVLFPLPTAP